MLLMGKIELADWLNNVLKEKNMSKADLARAAGLSGAQITRITNAEQGISVDTVVLLSSALKINPVEIFRVAAGLITPTKPTGEEEQLLYLFKLLPVKEKQVVMNYVQFLLNDPNISISKQ